MKTIEVVILANSVKHNQHCVAGKCTANGQWVRPVSNKNGAELSDEQAKYQNPYGKFIVKPLQKIIMNLSDHVPLANQPENYLIDGSTWKQNYSVSLEDLKNLLDNPSDIWGEGDKVLYSSITSKQIIIQQSLYILAVENLRLYKNQYSKRRASFKYNENNYDLAVTDPNFDKIILNADPPRGFLCISLAGEYQGYCYKIVATIF
jgi:hypothetical protein